MVRILYFWYRHRKKVNTITVSRIGACHYTHSMNTHISDPWEAPAQSDLASSTNIFTNHAVCSRLPITSSRSSQHPVPRQVRTVTADNISHQYKTTDNIIAFRDWTFTFINSWREYKRFWTQQWSNVTVYTTKAQGKEEVKLFSFLTWGVSD